MPKRVDHQGRRRQIIEALWRITASDGLEEATLRRIAAEAGVSMGMVQHYFTNKDEMMQFALTAVSERVLDRLARHAADTSDTAAPYDTVRALLIEMLPLDEDRRLEANVAFAFFSRAAVRPAIAEQLREDTNRMQEFLAEQIRSARPDRTSWAVEPAEEAAALLALVDGLSVHTLAGHYPPQRALAIFEAQLDRIFGNAED
jgi:AcrR family transcriptional regulator